MRGGAFAPTFLRRLLWPAKNKINLSKCFKSDIKPIVSNFYNCVSFFIMNDILYKEYLNIFCRKVKKTNFINYN